MVFGRMVVRGHPGSLEKRMVTVVLKTGKRYCGELWCWRPLEGWFSLVGDDLPDKFYLEEIQSAVNKGVRTHPGIIEDVDLLKRAEKECSESQKM